MAFTLNLKGRKKVLTVKTAADPLSRNPSYLIQYDFTRTHETGQYGYSYVFADNDKEAIKQAKLDAIKYGGKSLIAVSASINWTYDEKTRRYSLKPKTNLV